MDPDLPAFSDHPSFRDIVASVALALTFFAFLGFGVITFTAKDLHDPGRQLSRAMYLALTLALGIHPAVSLGVFGTLTVQEVIDSGGPAVAVVEGASRQRTDSACIERSANNLMEFRMAHGVPPIGNASAVHDRPGLGQATWSRPTGLGLSCIETEPSTAVADSTRYRGDAVQPGCGRQVVGEPEVTRGNRADALQGVRETIGSICPRGRRPTAMRSSTSRRTLCRRCSDDGFGRESRPMFFKEDEE